MNQPTKQRFECTVTYVDSYGDIEPAKYTIEVVAPRDLSEKLLFDRHIRVALNNELEEAEQFQLHMRVPTVDETTDLYLAFSHRNPITIFVRRLEDN